MSNGSEQANSGNPCNPAKSAPREMPIPSEAARRAQRAKQGGLGDENEALPRSLAALRQLSHSNAVIWEMFEPRML